VSLFFAGLRLRLPGLDARLDGRAIMSVSRERRILYDLTVHAELEARCTNELVPEAPSYGQRFFRWGPNLQRAGALLGYFSLPPAVREHAGLRPAYSLHASPDGEHVAVLTREGLFVRSRAAGFEDDDGEPTWPLPPEAAADGRPGEWQVAWEQRGEAVAVATASGHLFVVERSGDLRCSRAAPLGLAGMAFCGSDEVLCVTHDGKLYRLGARSADSGAELPAVTASVLEGAGGGVDAVVACICIDAARNALYVGGAMRGLPSLSRWRASPGAEVTPLPSRVSCAEELPAPNPGFSMTREDGQPVLHACCQVRVSPSGRFVAAADTGGRAIVWPADGGTPPVACANAHSVTDVAWWGDDALAMAQRAGAVSIDAISDAANLLGDPEVFNPFSAICSVSGGDDQHQLLVLEGPELEDVQEGAGIGTLALCRLQQTTPEQKFAVQLENKEYGSALQLAQYYGLSTDEVYKAQWLDAPVSRESNSDYLSKVKEPGWALEQCLHRVVSTGKEARCLVDHGMTLTNLPRLQQHVATGGESVADMEPEPETDGAEPEPEPEGPFALTAEEIHLCEVRAELVRHRNRLSTHIEIQRGYNRDVFLRFRDAVLVDEAMEYALQGNIKGVELLLTHHGREDNGSLLAQRLALLKNLPETAKPKSYGKLLPALDGTTVRDLALAQWHDDDYVDSPIARALWNPAGAGAAEAEAVPQMPGVTAADVAAWYSERALEIDERSGQVYVAQELLREGLKNGVPDLEPLAQTVKELIDIVERGTASVDMTIPQYQRLTPEHRLSCFIGDCTEQTVADAVFIQAKGLLQSNPGLLEEFLLSKASAEFEIPAAVLLHGSAPQSKGELVKSNIFADENDFILAVLGCIYSCEQTGSWELLWQVWESVAIRNKGKACSDLSYRTLHCMLDKLHDRLEAAQITSSTYKMRYEIAFFGNTDDQSTLDAVKAGEWKDVKRSTATSMASDFQFLHLPASVELQILGDARLRKAQDKVRLVCTRWRKHAAKIQSVHQVLRSLPRSVSARTVEAGSAGLKMIQHVQFLHDVFCCVPYEDALLYSLEGLLVKGYHTTAQQLIDGTLPAIEGLRPIDALHDSESESLTAKRIGHVALNAARELINGCNDLRNCKSDCKAARACLSVIGDMHDQFSRGFMEKLEDEENFIEGVQELSAFNMKSFKLPLQVRQCEDKMLILREVLEGQDVYANVETVVDLFDILGLRSKEDRLRVQAEMAQFAFQTGDMRIACDQTLSLIDAGYGGAWSLGHTIGKMWNSDTVEMNQPSSITSCDNALSLLGFAVHHCPSEALPKVLSDWRKCEELVAKHSDDGLGKLLGQVEDRIEKRAAAVANQAEHLLTGLGGASQQVLSVFRPLNAHAAVQEEAQPEPESEPAKHVQTVGVHPFYAERISDAVAAQVASLEATQASLPTSTVDSVAQWVAANTFDLPLCVAVLLDMPEPQHIEDVLNRLVQNSAIKSSLQCTLGLMCFSLILVGHKEGPTGVQKLLESSEDDVGSTAAKYAETASNDANAEVSYCAQQVMHYHETAGDAELQNVLDVTRVDREKFFMNEQYRSSEIARLISSGYHRECERLLEFMDIPLWHMHSQLLQQRLQTDGDDAPDEWTRDKTSLLSEPIDMEKMLREELLASLDGTQHKRLVMCLDLLSECCQLNGSDDIAMIEQHATSLRAVLGTPQSFRQGLDYRQLVGTADFSRVGDTQTRDDVIKMLGAHVCEDNIAVVAKILLGMILQSGSVDSSLVYRSYVERELDACENVDHEWHRLAKQLKECDALDTLSVCKCACDLQKWPIAVCSRILADGIKLADAKLLKSKADAAGQQVATEMLQSLKRQSAYMKAVVKMARDGHEDWAEWLESSLDPPTIRTSLTKMAALGCPEVVMANAAKIFLALSGEALATEEAISAEVGRIYTGGIDLSLASYSACEVDAQRSALTARLFNQFKLPHQPGCDDHDADPSAAAPEARQSTEYWDSPPPGASLDRLLRYTCSAEVSASTAQTMCVHLIDRWCAAGVPCSPGETSGSVAPNVALLAVKVLSQRAKSDTAAQYRPQFLYYTASLLFQQVVGWSPDSDNDDVSPLIAHAAQDAVDQGEARVAIVRRLHEMFDQAPDPSDWANVLCASVVLVLCFTETQGEPRGEDQLWVLLLQAIVQHGDVVGWVEPTTIACADTYRAQRGTLSVAQYQCIMALLTARADEEWRSGSGEAAGRLEAVAAAMGLGAGYDEQGLTDQVVARLESLPAARLAAWPKTGPRGLEAVVMASLVEKGRVAQLATTVLWCGGGHQESERAGSVRSAALLLDHIVAVRCATALYLPR
jgi:hypothetical protein